jgi:hypothetical protein
MTTLTTFDNTTTPATATTTTMTTTTTTETSTSTKTRTMTNDNMMQHNVTTQDGSGEAMTTMTTLTGIRKISTG